MIYILYEEHFARYGYSISVYMNKKGPNKCTTVMGEKPLNSAAIGLGRFSRLL